MTKVIKCHFLEYAGMNVLMTIKESTFDYKLTLKNKHLLNQTVLGLTFLSSNIQLDIKSQARI